MLTHQPHPLRIDIKADHPEVPRKFQCQGQADVAETGDADRGLFGFKFIVDTQD